MAKAKGSKAKTAPRRSRTGPKKKGKRKNTLNKSVKKPMQALGVAVGLASVYGAPIVASVSQKSVKPIAGAVMDKDTAIRAGRNALIGAVAGTAAGVVVDKFGLKKPVNRIIRTVRGFTGGLL